MEPSDEIGLAEAAHELKLSWHAAWRLALNGQLDARKVSRSWVVTRESVERLRAQREAPLQATA